MRSSSRLFRVSALLAATSLASGQAVAQAPGPAVTPPGAPAPGSLAPGPQASAPGGDPPSMVGRLAQLTGTVSFHGRRTRNGRRPR